MKRVIGTVLFGLGVLLAVLAVGLPLYVAPAVTKLPYDLDRSSSVAEAKNATFLQIKAGKPEVHRGDLRSTTNVVPRPQYTHELQSELKDQAVVWNVYSSTVRLDTNEKISESATEIALDRVSGEPVPWNGAWFNDGTKTTTKFAGQIYKFPFHTERKDYKFWDTYLRETAPPAKFRAVETIGGLEVYRFEQVIPWTKVNVPDSSLAVLKANFAAASASTAEVWYSNTRTIWAEPVTGQFLRVREQRKQEFRDGVAPTTLLDADFSYTQETTDNSVKTADGNRTKIQAVSVYAPIALGVLAVLLIAVGLLLFRQPRRGSHAATS